MASLGHIWSNGQISTSTKLGLYNSLVLSILLYGAEAWTLTATEERYLDTFDQRCLPRATPPLEAASLLKAAMSAGWSRPTGRPRRRWGDQLTSDLSTMGLDVATAWQRAQDRTGWKSTWRGATLPGAAREEPQPEHQLPQPEHQLPQPEHQPPQPEHQPPQPEHQLPQPEHQPPQPEHQLTQPEHQLTQPEHQLTQPDHQQHSQAKKKIHFIYWISNPCVSAFNLTESVFDKDAWEENIMEDGENHQDSRVPMQHPCYSTAMAGRVGQFFCRLCARRLRIESSTCSDGCLQPYVCSSSRQLMMPHQMNCYSSTLKSMRVFDQNDCTMKSDILNVKRESNCQFKKYERLRTSALKQQLKSASKEWVEENVHIPGGDKAIGSEIVDKVSALIDTVDEECTHTGTPKGVQFLTSEGDELNFQFANAMSGFCEAFNKTGLKEHPTPLPSTSRASTSRLSEWNVPRDEMKGARQRKVALPEKIVKMGGVCEEVEKFGSLYREQENLDALKHQLQFNKKVLKSEGIKELPPNDSD
ncbi:hypothetical protein Bbelb_051770 [Branchiostoma belcheri]|nr:hypothetical protein Bbelb_051770 [Branchiostoma belcheri]